MWLNQDLWTFVFCLSMSVYLSSRCCCRLSVPFELVPDLVSKRLVVLKSGRATITCKKTRPFLKSVFEKVLRRSLAETRENFEKNGTVDDDDDRRIENLLRQVRSVFSSTVMKRHGEASHGSVVLRSSDVDRVSSHFPLCFRRVHKDLVRQRRLQHHARVAYTLFLKEIGLPRHEAVTFWSGFYSRDPAKGCNSCSHSWETDEKKFTYRFSNLSIFCSADYLLMIQLSKWRKWPQCIFGMY